MEKSESGVQVLDLPILTWTHPENLDGVAAGRGWKGTCQRGKGGGQASEEGGKAARTIAAALEYTPLHRLASGGRDPEGT